MAVNNNADDYANARVGIFFPGVPQPQYDYLTGQCVSLVKWFLGEMCDIGDWQSGRGNAKDFGDTLVAQGLATLVSANNRKRGDIVVWKLDGGGYGHIGVLCSSDNVFEENVGLAGTKSSVYGGNTVYAARIDPLYASWRKGEPTFYRVKSYVENFQQPQGGDTTVDTIKSMYWRLLGREADQGGINTYADAAAKKGWEFVYNDLKNSAEGQADWQRRNPDRVAQLEATAAQLDAEKKKSAGLAQNLNDSQLALKEARSLIEQAQSIAQDDDATIKNLTAQLAEANAKLAEATKPPAAPDSQAPQTQTGQTAWDWLRSFLSKWERKQ